MTVTLNLTQAREVVAFFGGDDSEVVVRHCEAGHSGPGIYVHIDGHEEEGSIKLSDDFDEPLSDDLWAWLTGTAMKAKPVRLVFGVGYKQCAVEDATHVTLNIPGPTGKLTLPVILRGKREGTGCWTWNGSTDAPTLRPSVLTEGHSAVSNGPFRCHSWINDGAAQFLSDCSHELANKTVALLDLPPDDAGVRVTPSSVPTEKP